MWWSAARTLPVRVTCCRVGCSQESDQAMKLLKPDSIALAGLVVGWLVIPFILAKVSR